MNEDTSSVPPLTPILLNASIGIVRQLVLKTLLAWRQKAFFDLATVGCSGGENGGESKYHHRNAILEVYYKKCPLVMCMLNMIERFFFCAEIDTVHPPLPDRCKGALFPI